MASISKIDNRLGFLTRLLYDGWTGEEQECGPYKLWGVLEDTEELTIGGVSRLLDEFWAYARRSDVCEYVSQFKVSVDEPLTLILYLQPGVDPWSTAAYHLANVMRAFGVRGPVAAGYDFSDSPVLNTL